MDSKAATLYQSSPVSDVNIDDKSSENGTGGVESNGPFSGSSDLFKSVIENDTKVSVNDDVENSSKTEVLEGEEGVESSGSGVANPVVYVNGVEPVGLEDYGDSSGDKIDKDENSNEFVSPVSEEGLKGQEGASEIAVEKVMPIPEVVANDDVGNLDKVGELEGEKAVDVSEEELSAGNGFTDSTAHVANSNGEVQPSSEDKVAADGKLNEIEKPTSDVDVGVHQEKMESDELKGEEIKEEDAVVETINVNVTPAGVVIVGEQQKNEQRQEEIPDVKEIEDVQKQENVTAHESVASVDKADEIKNIVEDVANMTVSEVDDLVAKSAVVSGTETEQVGENASASRSIEMDKETDQMASDSIQSNGGLEDEVSGGANHPDTSEILEGEDETNAEYQINGEDDLEGSISDQESDGMMFGSSEAARQFIEELERESGHVSHPGSEASRDVEQRIDGQIVTDSDEEVDTDEEGDGKRLLDSSALAALLKAATGADPDGGSFTITSQDGSRLFQVERPAGLGSSFRSLRGPGPQSNRSSFFNPIPANNSESENLTEEEKKKLEKLQEIRVKFLRLVQRLGFSTDESIATQVLYRFSLTAGKQNSQLFSIDTAKSTAQKLEEEAKDDLDFSVNILVLGKSGVGKSATINSILGEEKATINAFAPATTSVKEICGTIDGVKIRVFDTPGLKPSARDQPFNRSVLSTVKRLTKKNPIDIVLYVDRLDAQTRDLSDLQLLRTITSSLGSAIWRSAIVTLTHGASAPPDGPTGSPLSYDVFVTQRSRTLQQSIGQAMGDLHMMSPSMMNPVSLVENHPACRRNREGNRILPNGQVWKPQLLLLCYSMKILSEASSVSKPQDPFDHRRLFGFRTRSPPVPYMLSLMLQSRPHPKLPSEFGGDNVDSDIDLDDLSDSDKEEEDEYDQLPPFKPLRKAQVEGLSKQQRKAYFEEYDYRVKLLQKKQWREELRRMREMKKNKGKATAALDNEEDDNGAAAPVAVPLPDMVLPPSFDSDNPTYRYRFLEPTSQFMARPVLDTHGWDHDCGYEGVNIEHSQAIANRFPAAITVQVSKDKKDFTISLDSSVAAKHGENGSSMAGFDIQNIGKQLAYIVRGETKFKILKKNKTAAGVSVTFLGENIVTGLKLEDQITLSKEYVIVGSAGTVRSKQETAYGANIELQRRDSDYPIGQVQSTLSMSLIKWRGDLAMGLNALAQFSTGRNSKVAVRAGINNKLSGQISVKTSSSDNLALALTAVLPVAVSIYRKFYPNAAEKYSIY